MEVPDDSIEKGFEGAFGDAEFAQRAKRDDALIVFNRPRIGFAVDLLDNCKKLAAGLQDIKVPFIALHGTLDDRTEPKNTQELADRSLGEDKTVVMVEGGKHQLLQDRAEITADVIQRVLEWVGPALLNMHVKDCDRVREL